MKHGLQEVGVAARWDSVVAAAMLRFTPAGQPRLVDHRPSVCDGLWEIEDDATRPGMFREDGHDEAAVRSTDVDYPSEVVEVVRSDDRVHRAAGESGHRLIENGRLTGLPGPQLPDARPMKMLGRILTCPD